MAGFLSSYNPTALNRLRAETLAWIQHWRDACVRENRVATLIPLSDLYLLLTNVPFRTESRLCTLDECRNRPVFRFRQDDWHDVKKLVGVATWLKMSSAERLACVMTSGFGNVVEVTQGTVALRVMERDAEINQDDLDGILECRVCGEPVSSEKTNAYDVCPKCCENPHVMKQPTKCDLCGVTGPLDSFRWCGFHPELNGPGVVCNLRCV